MKDCDLCKKPNVSIFPFSGGHYCKPCIQDMIFNRYEDEDIEVEEDDMPFLGFHLVFEPEEKKKPKEDFLGLPASIKEEDVIFDESPQKIKDELDKYVIGQDKAKKAMAISLYNHMLRFVKGKEIRKSNILLVGPSGSGKTLIAESVAKIMGLPFVNVNITEYTQAGYVGKDIMDILPKLGDNPETAENADFGIVFIDEVDKLATRQSYNSEKGSSVSQKGVQRELLKLIEGDTKFYARNSNNRIGSFRTKNVLFILAGAFSEREKKEAVKNEIGFDSKSKATNHSLQKELIDYGMMAELIGRIPVIAELDYLSDEEMIRSITEPKDAIINDYINYFEERGSKLEFEKEAFVEIVRKAKELETGVRGIKSIIDEVLQEDLFDVPGLEKPVKVKVFVKKGKLVTKRVQL